MKKVFRCVKLPRDVFLLCILRELSQILLFITVNLATNNLCDFSTSKKKGELSSYYCIMKA